MHFRLHDGEGTHSITLEFGELIIAGMTGRDVKAVQAHIDELAEIGVPGPSSIPIYYLVSATLLTTASRLQVIGGDSSGEVEAVLLGTPEGMLVGVGSDHTDRKMETDSIAISKQVCPKSISRDLWRYADVVAGWDDIELVSDRIVDGVRTPYQRGKMAAVRKSEDLIGGYFDGLKELPAGVAMYTGTIPTIGDITGADHFAMALVDPGNGRTLWHDYDTSVLPLVS